jgi:hypothetical protein
MAIRRPEDSRWRNSVSSRFDMYDGPQFEAVVADEVEFLRHHLL